MRYFITFIIMLITLVVMSNCVGSPYKFVDLDEKKSDNTVVTDESEGTDTDLENETLDDVTDDVTDEESDLEESDDVTDEEADIEDADNEISDDATDEANDTDEFIPESCDDLTCQDNATCYESVTGPQCVCDDGYGEVEEGVCEEVEEGWDRFEIIKHLDGNMIFDKETNLTWPQGLEDLQQTLIKVINIASYKPFNICTQMNENQYGGHNDWRPATYQNFVDIISEEVLDYQEHKCKYTDYEESYDDFNLFPYYDEYCYMTDDDWTELERDSIFYKQFQYSNDDMDLFVPTAFTMEWIDLFNHANTQVKGGAALSASRGLPLYAWNVQLSNYDTEPPTNYIGHMRAYYTGEEKVNLAHICVR